MDPVASVEPEDLDLWLFALPAVGAAVHRGFVRMAALEGTERIRARGTDGEEGRGCDDGAEGRGCDD